MALWTDIDPAYLTGFARVEQEAADTSVWSTILPNLYQDEVKFTWKVGESLEGEAEFGEFDTEAPIGDSGALEEKTIRLLPVSRKVRLSEYRQVTELDRIQALAEERAAQVARMVVNRLTRARAAALVNGALALNENRVQATADFGRDAAQTGATPAALWSATGADPIADLTEWVATVTDNGGQVPTHLIVSTKVATAMAGALGDYVTGASPIVSRDAVNEVLASHSLPRLTVDDTRVGGQRVMDEDTIVLAVAGAVGRTVFAPTVESTDPRYNLAGNESGIVAGIYNEDDPPIKWVLGKAVALPILSNPNLSLSATVL